MTSGTYSRQAKNNPIWPTENLPFCVNEANLACLQDSPVVLLKAWEQLETSVATWHIRSVTSAAGSRDFAFARGTLGDSWQKFKSRSCCLEWREKSPRWALVSLRRKCFVSWMEAQEDTAQGYRLSWSYIDQEQRDRIGLILERKEFKLKHKK